MTRVPLLSPDSLRKVNQDHDRLRNDMHAQERRWRAWLSAMQDTGTEASIAFTDAVIPKRVDDIAGGPIDVTRVKLSGGVLVTDGTVKCYSWVKTDSADPADEDGGILYIGITQDKYGTWWFSAQDCTQPPTTVTDYPVTATTVITTALTEIPGTQFNLPDFHGVYNYGIYLELEVVGIPGNQGWDIVIGLYNETKARWELSFNFAGNGDPPANPTKDGTIFFNVDENNSGDTVQMYGLRTTTTGTISVLQYLDASPSSGTLQVLTGPFH